MSKVCSGCGRNIDRDFVYCPWCGEKRMGRTQDFFDMVYSRYSTVRQEQRNRQFNAAKQRLNELEQELNVLVLSAELHK